MARKFLDYTGVSYLWQKIIAELNKKANNQDLATVATSGSYNDLINKPAIPTKVSDLQDDSGHYIKPVGGIPAQDLAETYLTQHQDISGKANSADLAAVATSGSYNDLLNKPFIPSAVSDLTDDSGHYTKPAGGIPASDLAETYLTSFTETDPTVPSWAKVAQKPSYTAAEVGAPTVQEMNTAIGTAIGNINSFDMSVVQELPSQDISTHTIYLVPKTGETNDVYDEYVYINSNWEMVGNTQIDLSNYVQKTDYAAADSAGVVKVDPTQSTGIGITAEGILAINPAGNNSIKQSTGFSPLVPSRQHASTFYGLAKAAGDTTQSQSNNTVGTYTTEAKAAIRSMIGAAASADIPTNVSELTNDAGYLTQHQSLDNYVQKTDYADGTNAGVVKINPTYGIGIMNGFLLMNGALLADIKTGSYSTKPISPYFQHASTFYGLAKAAGDTTQSQSDNAVGTYTAAAKTAIRAMLGATSSNVIEVSDTQPTDTDNKIWMPETAPAGIEVPTYAEFQAGLAGKVSDVQINGSSIVANNVANIPIASSSSSGTIKVAYDSIPSNNSASGSILLNQVLYYIGSGPSYLKSGKDQAALVSAAYQHTATFYGLAKAAGADMKDLASTTVGIYPAAQKAAIQNMLGISNILAPTETVVASKAYGIGEIFTSNGKLYKATAAIAASDTIVTQDAGETVSGSNAEEIKISEYAVRDVQVNGSSVVNNGVVNLPKMSTSTFGVAKTANYGVTMGVSGLSDYLVTVPASDNYIKVADNSNYCTYQVITPVNQHKAVFYGLAKAAGDTTQSASSNAVGTYTSEAKAAIQSMLGINLASIASEVEIPLVETVTGTTPTITGQPNTRYNCGEVSTISITPPASGSIVVIFESGSTAAVLTVPNTVKWPTWFDATTLETDTIYEILITDGVYGSVMTWAS